MSMLDKIPPYPADGTRVQRATWVYNYGPYMMMSLVVFIHLLALLKFYELVSSAWKGVQ